MNIPIPARLVLTPLATGLFWLATVVGAQAGSTGNASLAVDIDAGGYARVGVFVGAALPKPEALASAVSATLGLKLEDVDLDVEEFKKVVTLSAESATPFPHTRTRASGQIDLKPLADFLRGAGIQSLSVRLMHPRCPQTRCSAARKIFSDPVVEYHYDAVLGGKPLPSLEFEFGYSSADLLRILGPLLLVLVMPVGFTLVRRRVPALKGRDDAWRGLKPEATRFLFWVGVVTCIVWVAAVYALRGDELSWFAFGCDWMWPQMAAVVGAFVLPPLWALMVSYRVMAGCCRPCSAGEPVGPEAGGGSSASRRLEGRGPAEAGTTNGGGIRARSLWRTGWSTAGAQLGSAVPMIFLAVGVGLRREGSTDKGTEWLAVAATAVIISIGTLCWARSEQAGRTLESARADSVRKRHAARVWWVSVAVAVLLPALAVRFAEQWRRDDTVRMMIYAGGLAGIVLVAGVTSRWLRRGIVRRLQSDAPHSGVHPAPVRCGAGRILLFVQPFVVGGIAFVACELFDFPFDLTRGDEGWGLVLMSFCVAVVQMLPRLKHAEVSPGGCPPSGRANPSGRG